MKILTVRQPFATLIALGIKPIENRSWSANYTGLVAIHAAKKPDVIGAWNYARRKCDEIGVPFPDERFPYGSIVAVASLYGTIYTNVDDEIDGYSNYKDEWLTWWIRDQYGWVFKKPRQVEPFIYTGQLGLRDLPLNIASQLKYIEKTS